MKINIKYLIVFILLLLIETFIALYVRDAFVRPYLGDSIAVAFVYTFIMIFIKKSQHLKPKIIVASISLSISFFVEALQATSFLEITGLDSIKWARIILGASFSWEDILAYTGGFIAVVIIEWLIYKRANL